MMQLQWSSMFAAGGNAAVLAAKTALATVFTGTAIHYFLNFIKNSCFDKRKRRK